MGRWPVQPITVLCGPGNNGGDGYVAARKLAERGWPVVVAASAPAAGAAAEAAARRTGPAEALTPALAERPGLIIDALYGAGLSRPLDGVAAILAEQIDRSRVIAIDVPSGVLGDGRISGPAFSAALTVTFARKKPAHVLYPARARCGDIVLADIGIPTQRLRRRARRPGKISRDSGRENFRGRRSRPTSIGAGAWPSPPEAPHAPARLGCQREARCGPAPAW